MEDLINRIPLIASFVFDELDNHSLLKCTEVSKELNNFIKNEKLFWLRIIQKYGKNLGTPVHQGDEEKSRPDWDGVRRLPLPKPWKKTVDNSPLEFVRQLSEATEKFFTKRSSRLAKQWHPLFVLADQGLLKLFIYFCEKTGEINPKGNKGITVLHMAVQGGHLEVCEFIIKRIDKNPKDDEGFTPFHLAAYQGHFEICKLMMQYVYYKNPADKFGNTPLHAAAQEGHLEISKFMISNVANKNPANGGGNTPLHIAALRGHSEICKFLISHIEEKDPLDYRGQTPLHAAADGGHLETYKVIMDEVENKNPQAVNGVTPLQLAFWNGHLDVYRLIVIHVAKDPIDQTWVIPCYLLTLVIKIIRIILVILLRTDPTIFFPHFYEFFSVDAILN